MVLLKSWKKIKFLKNGIVIFIKISVLYFYDNNTLLLQKIQNSYILYKQ